MSFYYLNIVKVYFSLTLSPTCTGWLSGESPLHVALCGYAGIHTTSSCCSAISSHGCHPKGEFPSSMPAFKCFGPKMILVITVLTSLAITNSIVLPYCKRALRSSLLISLEEPNVETQLFFAVKHKGRCMCALSAQELREWTVGPYSLAIYSSVWSKPSYLCFPWLGFFVCKMKIVICLSHRTVIKVSEYMLIKYLERCLAHRFDTYKINI